MEIHKKQSTDISIKWNKREGGELNVTYTCDVTL